MVFPDLTGMCPEIYRGPGGALGLVGVSCMQTARNPKMHKHKNVSVLWATEYSNIPLDSDT